MGKVLYLKGKESTSVFTDPAFGPAGEKICAIVIEGPEAEILSGIANPQARENMDAWDEEMEISFKASVRKVFRDFAENAYSDTTYPPAILIIWDPAINESGIIIDGSLFDICYPGFISDDLRKILRVMWNEGPPC